MFEEISVKEITRLSRRPHCFRDVPFSNCFSVHIVKAACRRLATSTLFCLVTSLLFFHRSLLQRCPLITTITATTSITLDCIFFHYVGLQLLLQQQLTALLTFLLWDQPHDPPDHRQTVNSLILGYRQSLCNPHKTLTRLRAKLPSIFSFEATRSN